MGAPEDARPGSRAAPPPGASAAGRRSAAQRWVEQALAECRTVWSRVGRRYARRLVESDRRRDAVGDVLTLAARRVAPLPRRVVRPLPETDLGPLERAFNRLDPADRWALSRLDRLGAVRGVRAEHLATALQRLVEAARENDRPPP